MIIRKMTERKQTFRVSLQDNTAKRGNFLCPDWCKTFQLLLMTLATAQHLACIGSSAALWSPTAAAVVVVAGHVHSPLQSAGYESIPGRASNSLAPGPDVRWRWQQHNQQDLLEKRLIYHCWNPQFISVTWVPRISSFKWFVQMICSVLWQYPNDKLLWTKERPWMYHTEELWEWTDLFWGSDSVQFVHSNDPFIEPNH